MVIVTTLHPDMGTFVLIVVVENWGKVWNRIAKLTTYHSKNVEYVTEDNSLAVILVGRGSKFAAKRNRMKKWMNYLKRSLQLFLPFLNVMTKCFNILGKELCPQNLQKMECYVRNSLFSQF